MSMVGEGSQPALDRRDGLPLQWSSSTSPGNLLSLFANVDSEAVKAQAVAKVQSAVERQKNKVSIL